MPPFRIPTAELNKLFNSAKQPVYVLDEELTIVFLNRAAYDWLGVEESIIGRRCTYHSSPSTERLDAVAAGLCPPPQVMLGKSLMATVSRTTEDGRPIERRARFLPMGVGADDLLGILAILETTDQPLASAGGYGHAETAEAGPDALHEQVRRFRQEAAARYRADRLIGQGPAMRLARRQVELAVVGGGSVLLVGPNGSGRRHLATAIHYGSSSGTLMPYQVGAAVALPRLPEGRQYNCPPNIEAIHYSSKAGTLVPLDCSLLGADLLETVLAAMAKEKYLGTQNTPGTLLFHRIDEISIDIQVELAGLLTHRPLVWRLMATAAEPLVELSRRGKFRMDLAAALSTITIELPPLVQRRDDLPLLAQVFLEERNAEGPRQIGGFTPAALDLLDNYSWPDNLDELAAVIAEAHQRATDREIDVADLPDRLRLASQAAAHPRRAEETIVLDEYLGRVERELIRRALSRAKGNKAQAARLLGTTRPRLYRRMEQLGIE